MNCNFIVKSCTFKRQVAAVSVSLVNYYNLVTKLVGLNCVCPICTVYRCIRRINADKKGDIFSSINNVTTARKTVINNNQH